MCGIVGRAGLLANQDERVFKCLLLLDYLRGQDSTGVAVISKNGDVDVIKVADDPIILFNTMDYDNTVVGATDAIWIGHNRAATIGGTTRSNAHPFKCNHITGVHNGTLEKSSLGELDYRLERSFGTDSETIYQHMAEYGVDETVKRLQGAWALVWYNEEEDTLNMIRNDKRPLYLCEVERDGVKLLTWASEFEMITAARAMASKDDGALIKDDKGYCYFPLPVNQLHTWKLADLLSGNLKPETRYLAGKPDPVVTTTTFFNNTNKPANNTQQSFTNVDDVYKSVETEVEENGKILGEFDEDEWNELTKFGCSCCGKDIDPTENGLVVYANEGTVICPTCSGESRTTVYNSGSPLHLLTLLG